MSRGGREGGRRPRSAMMWREQADEVRGGLSGRLRAFDHQSTSPPVHHGSHALRSIISQTNPKPSTPFSLLPPSSLKSSLPSHSSSHSHSPPTWHSCRPHCFHTDLSAHQSRSISHAKASISDFSANLTTTQALSLCAAGVAVWISNHRAPYPRAVRFILLPNFPTPRLHDSNFAHHDFDSPETEVGENRTVQRPSLRS
jgi:hypothetical protein